MARTVPWIILVLTLLGGCNDAGPAPEPEPLSFAWQEVALPVPPGPAGRLAPRDATACGERWYVVGAVIGPDDATRPAAWTSADDGQTWTSMRFHPRTFYGEQAVLYSAACRGDEFATIGAKSGGAHGNPRVTQWYLRPDGVVDEVIAGFQQYGGPTAGSVRRIVASPDGWLIAGNRASGGAVWLSRDATAFELVEGVPPLARDAAATTAAADAVRRPEGWVVVGGAQAVGRIDRDPAAFLSADGKTWSRVGLPGTNGYDDLQRVVVLDDDLVAVGLAGASFGAWRRTGGSWQQAGRFGSTGSSGTANVPGVAVAGKEVFVSASDGTAHSLWASVDGGVTWQSVVLPGAAPAGSDRSATLAGSGERLILVVDDGLAGKLWSTKIAPG